MHLKLSVVVKDVAVHISSQSVDHASLFSFHLATIKTIVKIAVVEGKDTDLKN